MPSPTLIFSFSEIGGPRPVIGIGYAIESETKITMASAPHVLNDYPALRTYWMYERPALTDRPGGLLFIEMIKGNSLSFQPTSQ